MLRCVSSSSLRNLEKKDDFLCGHKFKEDGRLYFYPNSRRDLRLESNTVCVKERNSLFFVTIQANGFQIRSTADVLKPIQQGLKNKQKKIYF